MVQQTFNDNGTKIIIDNLLGVSIEPFVLILFGHSCNKILEKVGE